MLLVLAALVIAALAFAASRSSRRAVVGGASGVGAARSHHLVVDTLNLVHWLAARRGVATKLSADAIVAAVDATAPALRARHSGRVYYVVKDRSSQLNDESTHAAFAAAAARNGVYLCAVERYADPPPGNTRARDDEDRAAHSAQGRDDFFMGVLAARLRCAVLTEDRLRDFGRFRSTLDPFHVLEFAFWRDQPLREFVRPDAAAFARLKKPRGVRFADYFDDALKSTWAFKKHAAMPKKTLHVRFTNAIDDA